MAEFTVVLHRDDARDAQLTDEERERAWNAHLGFQQHCADRGWEIVATRALGAASRGRSLRSDGRAGVVVTDGPYAETAEQVAGFYLVARTSLGALTEAVGALVLNGESVEIRPTVRFVDGVPVDGVDAVSAS
ncbi:YciI family protein [Cellulomonas sp.]|uniref:YciI family protein n=1 Tax=Cellulomonas sp. TaxID=40001 RepID=UPI003BA86B62